MGDVTNDKTISERTLARLVVLLDVHETGLNVSTITEENNRLNS